jgi:hypothetical protein
MCVSSEQTDVALLADCGPRLLPELRCPTAELSQATITVQARLDGLRVAILGSDDFEQIEMTESCKALE